ncbi:hypothetical protein PG996_013603 [Apiospora saccharicola]|uniref:Uncharacterized protein n=1 Tax=Apiospora saccharicola TaxID=335842 RepID=A0ABR1U5Y1_9PEZI
MKVLDCFLMICACLLEVVDPDLVSGLLVCLLCVQLLVFGHEILLVPAKSFVVILETVIVELKGVDLYLKILFVALKCIVLFLKILVVGLKGLHTLILLLKSLDRGLKGIAVENALQVCHDVGDVLNSGLLQDGLQNCLSRKLSGLVDVAGELGKSCYHAWLNDPC